jgi:hypothetical protein
MGTLLRRTKLGKSGVAEPHVSWGYVSAQFPRRSASGKVSAVRNTPLARAMLLLKTPMSPGNLLLCRLLPVHFGSFPLEDASPTNCVGGRA